MTDAEFAKIKARFPSLRWRRVSPDFVPGNGGEWVHTTRDGYELAIVRHRDDRWQYRVDGNGVRLIVRGFHRTLGRCLRSLECALVREAKALAGLAGMKVCV